MGPLPLENAFWARIIIAILFGAALAVGLPWMWDVVLRPLLRVLVA